MTKKPVLNSMVTLAGPRGPRAALPPPPVLARHISKSLRQLLDARARTRCGGSDLAWLRAHSPANRDVGVVELMVSCEPRFEYVTPLWGCVSVFL